MKATKQRAQEDASGLARFVSAENVTRYRKLLSAKTDESERRVILQQLAREKARLRDS